MSKEFLVAVSLCFLTLCLFQSYLLKRADHIIEVQDLTIDQTLESFDRLAQKYKAYRESHPEAPMPVKPMVTE